MADSAIKCALQSKSPKHILSRVSKSDLNQCDIINHKVERKRQKKVIKPYLIFSRTLFVPTLLPRVRDNTANEFHMKRA